MVWGDNYEMLGWFINRIDKWKFLKEWFYLSYIPIKDEFSFDTINFEFDGYTQYNSILASIYAKNNIIKDFAGIIKSNPTTFESLKTYLNERLTEDDIEMAQGYLNAVSVENTTPQAINQMQSALIELILKDIESELGGLQWNIPNCFKEY